MDFEWNKKFETGHEEVDLQHHYFISLINRIHKEYDKTLDKDQQTSLLVELIKYADFHFTSEENIAFALQSPELEQHKERHKELLQETEKHIIELQDGSITIDQFASYLYEWFAGHTLYEDRKLLVAK